MELSFPHTELETSASFVTKAFSLGDQKVIMTLLRSKLYSYPIRTICQEIMSNARDAHREVGKPEVPIVVTIPNNLDPTFKVQDFGPGISPARMWDVFVQYGNSTKRADNVQTGGFGLGAKSPFSYVDSFSIVTVTAENGKMVRREYCAYIDPTQIGAMSVVKEEVTDEKQGTTIVIPCKPGDERSFVEGVRGVSNYWAVRPEIKGRTDFRWDEVTFNYKANDGSWGVALKDDSRIVLDGIPYRMQLDLLYPGVSDWDKNEDRSFAKHGLHLFLPGGSLKVTASREDLDYQPEVIFAIKEYIKKARKDIEVVVNDQISMAKTWWEACVAARMARSNMGWIDVNQHTWNGLKLRETISSDRCSKFWRFERVRSKHKSSGQHNVYISVDVMVVEDDLDCSKPSAQRVATLFDQNPGVNNIFVLSRRKPEAPNPAHSAYDKANAATYAKDYDEALKEWETEYQWSKLGIVKLSTIPAKKIQRVVTNVAPAAKARLFEYETVSDCWSREDSIDLQAGKGHFVVLYKNRAYLEVQTDLGLSEVWNESEAISSTDLLAYHNYCRKGDKDFRVYGISTRNLGKLGPGWVNLKIKLAAEAKVLVKDRELKKLIGADVHINDDALYGHAADIVPTLADKSGVGYKMFSMALKFQTQKSQSTQLMLIMKMLKRRAWLNKVNSQKFDWTSLTESFGRTYPLLEYQLNRWFCKRNVPDIVLYINSKDAEIRAAARAAKAAKAAKAKAEADKVAEAQEVENDLDGL